MSRKTCKSLAVRQRKLRKAVLNRNEPHAYLSSAFQLNEHHVGSAHDKATSKVCQSAKFVRFLLVTANVCVKSHAPPTPEITFNGPKLSAR